MDGRNRVRPRRAGLLPDTHGRSRTSYYPGPGVACNTAARGLGEARGWRLPLRTSAAIAYRCRGEAFPKRVLEDLRPIRVRRALGPAKRAPACRVPFAAARFAASSP